MRSRLLQLTAATAALAVMLMPGAASALTYSPPTFDFSANPGDSLTDMVQLRNETQDALKIVASAYNFTGVPGDETEGKPDFYPADEVRDGRGLASWITFLDEGKTLLPGERANVRFRIDVPADADPGSHFGAIILTTTVPEQQAGVGVVGNSAALILLKVNGDALEDLKLTSFAAIPSVAASLPVTFEARLMNDGTVHERPYGEVTIKNLFGRTVAVLPMNRADNKSVLPGGARRFDSAWTGRVQPDDASTLSRQWNNFAFGPYTAEVALRYGVQNRVLTAKTTVWVFTWMPIALILVGLAVLVTGIKLLLDRYRKKIIADLEAGKKG